MKMPFGQFRGKEVAYLPSSYIIELVSLERFTAPSSSEQPLRAELYAELQRRLDWFALAMPVHAKALAHYLREEETLH